MLAYSVRHVLASLALVLVSGTACQLTPQPACISSASAHSNEDAAKDIEHKTVALLGRKYDQLVPYCAGVWVSDTGILTAAHCFDGEGPSTTVGYLFAVHADVFSPHDLKEQSSIQPRLAQLVATDATHDLALLRAFHPLPAHSVARVALDTLQPGSYVTTMGHAYGLWWSYSSGQVAAFRFRYDSIRTQVTTPIHKGNSGGGLFDIQNNLVGIASSCIVAPEAPTVCGSLNLFVHAQYLDAFIRKYDSDGRKQ